VACSSRVNLLISVLTDVITPLRPLTSTAWSDGKLQAPPLKLIEPVHDEVQNEVSSMNLLA